VIWIFPLAVLLLVLSHSSGARAQFADEEDRKLARALIAEVRRNCAQKVNSDLEALERIRLAQKRAQADRDQASDQCFRDHLSVITGVFYIYEKICNSITGTSLAQSDTVLGRRLLNVTKYQAGIRPYLIQLTNCLMIIPRQAGRKYITPMPSANLSAEAMAKAIEGIIVQDPFPATQEPFR